jgi:hypothetical protein
MVKNKEFHELTQKMDTKKINQVWDKKYLLD